MQDPGRFLTGPGPLSFCKHKERPQKIQSMFIEYSISFQLGFNFGCYSGHKFWIGAIYMRKCRKIRILRRRSIHFEGIITSENSFVNAGSIL